MMQIIRICKWLGMVEMPTWFGERLSRRLVLAGGICTAGATAAGVTAAVGQASHDGHAAGAARPPSSTDAYPAPAGDHSGAHGAMVTVGEVDSARNGFDPAKMLTDWDVGTTSTLPDGRTLRTFEIVAEDKEIEIAPGVMFPAWTYNGRVPGRPCAPPKASACASCSRTTARIRIRCTSTASTPRAWTACRVPA